MLVGLETKVIMNSIDDEGRVIILIKLLNNISLLVLAFTVIMINNSNKFFTNTGYTCL